jgi:hypothetical protein
VTVRQVAEPARSAGLPSLRPLSRGRPGLPVRCGARAYTVALCGSRVVKVVRDFAGDFASAGVDWSAGASRTLPWYAASPTPWMRWCGNAGTSTAIISAARSTWLAVPLPRHSRNSTGRHTGDEHNGRRTTIPTTTHRLPRPILCLPWAAPSCVQNAAKTFLPHRRNRVSSTLTVIDCTVMPAGSVDTSCAPGRRCRISRITPNPNRSTSHFAWEKNRHAAWNDTT